MAGSEARDLQTLPATVDANGVCTFSFPPPPQGQVRSGTIAVVDSPATTTWSVYLGAAPIGDSVPGVLVSTMLGQNGLAGIQQLANDYLVVQATGLTEGTTYNAALHSVVDLASKVPLSVPLPLSQASQTTVDISGSSVSISGGTVDVENASGTFLLTGDIPSVSIKATVNGSNEIVTTTPLPAGMRALVINPQPNLGVCLVNCYGNQSGVRYAFQAILGGYSPLVIPVDPETDSTYTIVFALNSEPAWSSSGLPIFAFAQPPDLPPATQQTANLDLISYSGTGKENIINGSNSFGSLCLVIDSITWVAFGSGASSAGLGFIYAVPMASVANEVLCGVLATSSGMAGKIDYPQGLPLLMGSGNPVYFAGNSSSTSFANVDITVNFHAV